MITILRILFLTDYKVVFFEVVEKLMAHAVFDATYWIIVLSAINIRGEEGDLVLFLKLLFWCSNYSNFFHLIVPYFPGCVWEAFFRERKNDSLFLLACSIYHLTLLDKYNLFYSSFRSLSFYGPTFHWR